jgi:hypothetical protein
VSQWQPGQSTHTPLSPGRRRSRGFARGLMVGAAFAGVIYLLIALIVWSARELLG